MVKFKQDVTKFFKKNKNNNVISKNSADKNFAGKPQNNATKLIINNYISGEKMKLHILGTGSARALKCYNTCFAIENNREYF